MTVITMPKLTDAMEEGTILTWLKQDGDSVETGEDLLEIETDKATVTHPAEASGILSVIASAGTTLAVGEPIGRLAEKMPVRSQEGDGSADVPVAASVDAPAAEGQSDSESDLPTVAPATSNGRGVVAGDDRQVKATPLARRVARAHGVSLEEIAGTGPLGRVTRGDVLTKAGLSPAGPSAPEGATTAEPAAAGRRAPDSVERAEAEGAKGTVESVAITRVQSTIARRMADAKATIPEFQVETEVEIDELISFRAQLGNASETVPSLNDLLIKAAALALRRHPRANGSYRDGRFELYSRVNVGVAVAAEQSLVVPTIFDADQKSLGAIAAQSRRLAAKVREGSISPAELSGATFTVSNLGMYAMTAITPVINPPQAAILGVGAARPVLRRVDGEIVDRQLMTLTLSCDHRILYGADAARFLSEIRELLEQPLRLVL